jgi:RimJ/RimL family protein N-acetyltransferase
MGYTAVDMIREGGVIEKGEQVELREVIEADLEAFFTQQLEPEATRMADFPSRDREAFFAHWHRILPEHGSVLKTILFAGQVAGNIVCWEQSGKWLVGYWLGREFWGKGIATRALLRLLEVVKTRPLFAYVSKGNRGSRRVLEKAGFLLCAEEGNEELWQLAGPLP